MTVDDRLFATPIYRSVSSYHADILYPPHGDRVPKHVPLLVDNVWEYIRPAGMPSRRSSAFGSPTAELARLSGPAEGVICRVFVTMPCPAAQIVGCSDARRHTDVATVPPAVARMDLPPDTVSLLSTALLSHAELGSFLPPAEDFVAMLAGASVFWQQCRRVQVTGDPAVDAVGELFFASPRGYALRPLHESAAV